MNNLDKAARIGKWYRRVGTITVGAVLFLILVGGVVRSTGSGMGCPDWPKCFGSYVPPTSVDQIPEAFYQTHPEFQTKTFNAFQTWTEYVNRLVGATIGLLVLITGVLSLTYWKSDRRIVWLSFLSVFLIGFEGWLGKLVVDKNLQGSMVTTHMFVAMVALMVLILAVYISYSRKPQFKDHAPFSTGMNWLGLGVMLVTMVQILIGTQVRENVDVIAGSMGGESRESWVGQLGFYYSIHRVVWAIVALALVVWVRNLIQAHRQSRWVLWMSLVALFGVGIEVLLGISLASMSLPAWMQPLHLLVANIIFAAEFGLLIYGAKVEVWGRKPLNIGKVSPVSQG